ncbi:DUF5060 domain-containing protein [Pedobacter sp. PWIIR3]
MKPIFNLAIALIFIIVAQPLFAQNKVVGYKSTSKIIKQYELAEWDIAIEAAFKNPYLQEEVALSMLIKSPSGKQLILPCYYESNALAKVSNWKSRFLPQEQGKYTYTFELKVGEKNTFSTKQGVFRALASTGKGILHANDDWSFKYDNGTVFRGIGENLAWESRADDDSKFFKALHEKDKYNYEYMLPSLAKHGGNYFRTWISSWNLPLDWKGGFNSKRYTPSDEYFNPSAIRKMDRLINLSDSLGLVMMLTLGEGTHDEKNGRYSTTTADFFVNEKAKAQYRNRLRFIVARWGYSGAIGAWEFFNEIDNVQFRNASNPINPAHIVQWHDEMSTYLKSIDPYQHLVTTSISHRDLAGLNDLKNIDFNQKHIYKNNRVLPTTIVKYAEEFKKPYVIGEYGYEYDWSKNFNLFADEMDSDFKRGLWYGLFSPTPILPLSWWWEFFDDRGTDAYIRNVSTISKEMLKAGKGLFSKLDVSTETSGIEVYAVKRGTHRFIYVYNPGRLAVSPVLTLPGKTAVPVKKIQQYDCETGKYLTATPALINDKGQLANFTLAPNTDTVFIL